MKHCLFTGAGVALITPMNLDGSVNYEKLKELVDWHINSKTDAIIVCGTTGEPCTLTDEEHREVIKAVVRRANGKIPVIAGTGSNDTQYAVNLSKAAQDLGVDGVLVVSPYYNRTSQAGLVKHYLKIADSIDIPLIIYDIPGRTGCKISLETFKVLSDHDNIVGVKAASGVISDVVSLAEACGDRLSIYSGNDDQIVPIMSLGGKGVISVLSNVVPKETHEICQFYLDGKPKESLELQLKFLDLVHALFIDVNPIPVKDAMNLMGMGVGPCRLPLCSLEPSKMEALKLCLKKYSLI